MRASSDIRRGPPMQRVSWETDRCPEDRRGRAMRTLLRLTWAFTFLALGAVVAHAQLYPSRQVQIIVAYPAGGAADLIMRSVASRLTQAWGQQILIENRAGGGTQTAADLVGKLAPDGHTLPATGMETFAISPFLHAKLSYDTKDFAPV